MIDLNKEYETRDGDLVRIYAVDAGGKLPIHGAVKRPGGWVRVSWYNEGKFLYMGHEHGYDLIEKPKTVVRWFNIYPHGVSRGYASKEEADYKALKQRIRCERVEFILD